MLIAPGPIDSGRSDRRSRAPGDRPGGRRRALDGIEEWAEATAEAPAIEPGALRTMLRLARLGQLAEAFWQELLMRFELTPSELDVLGALRAMGRPYTLRPSQLYAPLRRSSGGMTKILGRLEASGLVSRAADPEDGRSLLVALTPRGLALHDRVLRAGAIAGSGVLEGLAVEERDAVERVLARLLETLEAGPGEVPEPVSGPKETA
jgi:DNA-binding MarR family transcriptional regulator